MNIDFPYGSVTLNSEQYAVVTADPFETQRVLASAGSGKTTTITARIAWLITQCGVDPSQIVLLTFSRNAAAEMLARVRRLVGPVELWSGTFHALALKVMRCGKGNTDGGAEVVKASNYFIDELPVLWYNWMRTTEGRAWVGKLRYVVIDEFQDINEIQWKILEVLRHPGVRTILVGDDAQNIYTWRGSSTHYLLDYHNVVRRVKDYQLKMNYRSSGLIVDVANRIMRNIPTLPWKEHMVSGRADIPKIKPDVLFFWKAAEECAWIARTIEDIRRTQPGWSIAILGRNNAELYRVEEILLYNGLQVRLHADSSGHDHTRANNVGDGVIDVMTFHGSKGLEWDVVFLICLNDDSLPSRKGAADIVGERRLFYVAVTRARRRLFLTYNGNERNLTRFVREIGSQFLTYHGLAKYTLSDVEIQGSIMSLRGLLEGLDGVQWQNVRTQGLLPNIEKAVATQILPPGEYWSVPTWADSGLFCNFVRLFLKRCLWKSLQHKTNDPISFGDVFIQNMLFTLRIFREDMPFWEQWKREIQDAVIHFFRDRQRLPGAEFSDVEVWALEHGINWSMSDLIQVTKILGKIRGQLVPLRYSQYRLDEFQIGISNNLVPTEYRAEVLQSWRRFCNFDVAWNDCLVDIWRLGCLEQVASGRNAGLFHIPGIKHRFVELIPFLEMVEQYVIAHVQDSDSKNNTQLNPSWSESGFAPLVGDWISGDTLVRVGGAQTPDVSLWVETCLLAYLLSMSSGVSVRNVQIYHLFHGTLWTYTNVNMKAMKELFDLLVEYAQERK